MQEVAVLTIEQTIKNEIAKFDPFEKRIGELKEQYSGLTITDINDKEGYENVRLAIAELRGIRTGTEKDKKVIKKPFWDACSTIEEKSKWIISEVSKIEDPLQKRKDDIDAEKEKIKKAKLAAQEAVFIKRSMELSNMGVLYDGANFILEDASFEGVLVREADDEVYNDFILPKFKVIFDKHETIRIEEENIKKQQIEKEELERKEFARQQEEFRKQQAELEKQKEDAEKERLEFIRKQNEEIEAKNKKINEERSSLQSKRLKELSPFNPYGAYVDMVTLWALPESEYNTVLSKKKSEYEKSEEEKRKLIEEQAAKKERERIEEQQKQEVIKRKQEDDRKAEELAQSTDKVKYADLIKQLEGIKIPDMRSGQYRKKVAFIREKLEEIQNL